MKLGIICLARSVSARPRRASWVVVDMMMIKNRRIRKSVVGPEPPGYHRNIFMRRSWHCGRKSENLYMISTVNTSISLKRIINVYIIYI